MGIKLGGVGAKLHPKKFCKEKIVKDKGKIIQCY